MQNSILKNLYGNDLEKVTGGISDEDSNQLEENVEESPTRFKKETTRDRIIIETRKREQYRKPKAVVKRKTITPR